MTRALRIRVVIEVCASRPDHATFANATMGHTDQTVNVSKFILVNLRSLVTNTMICRYQLLLGYITGFMTVIISKYFWSFTVDIIFQF